MIVIAKFTAQGEKLHTQRVSQIDSTYTKLSSSIVVLLINSLKSVLA